MGSAQVIIAHGARGLAAHAGEHVAVGVKGYGHDRAS